MKKHIITITGFPGSGKSSTANAVARTLGYKRFSAGDAMRMIAARHNMNINELNAAAVHTPEFDRELDDIVKNAGNDEDTVIDSRTAFHFIPDSFKVMLKADFSITAHRTFAQLQQKDGGRLNQSAETVEEMQKNMEKNMESECIRYEKLYGINYTDESNYDLVVDTGLYTLDEVVALVCEAYSKWLSLD